MVSEHAHRVVAMQDHAQTNKYTNVHCIRFFMYLGLAQARHKSLLLNALFQPRPVPRPPTINVHILYAASVVASSYFKGGGASKIKALLWF